DPSTPARGTCPPRGNREHRCAIHLRSSANRARSCAILLRREATGNIVIQYVDVVARFVCSAEMNVLCKGHGFARFEHDSAWNDLRTDRRASGDFQIWCTEPDAVASPHPLAPSPSRRGGTK